MSKGITDKTEHLPGQRWESAVETAPSVLRDEEPTVARTIGLCGASCVIFGGAALLFNAFGWSNRVGVGWGTLILALGLVGLLTHASFDRDLQVRRLYWALGLALFGIGGILCMVPTKAGFGGLFGLGYPSIGVALLFLMAVHRHETDPTLRNFTLWMIGAAGLGMAVLAFLFGNNFRGDFLVPYGLLLALMGLAYLTAFTVRQGTSTELGYKAALAIGAIGVVAFLLGFLRSALPALFHKFGWLTVRPNSFLVPGGLLFMGLGLLYMAISVGLWSDNRLVVLTRRELAAFFYSPLAYIILVGLTVVGWFLFLQFLRRVLAAERNAQVLIEPIVQFYIIDWWPIICTIFIVPALTMRLLSEEKRAGTLEVLLTAPVNESTVVLSKFLACLILFLVLWVPWGLFLVALRIIGGQPFDYQPLMSYFIALACTGSGFIAMGLFFSSLTRNQVASAVLTFAGMLGLTMIFFVKRYFEPKSAWFTVLTHVSYVDVWIDSIQGFIVPKFLVFHLSAAVFWLFLTVKVLEARRWS